MSVTTTSKGLTPASWAAVGVAAAAVTGAALLWAAYGRTVFYEIVLAGFAMCL